MKLCKVEGCTNKHHAKGYCNKHYIQHRRYGESLTPPKHNRRSRYTNEIIQYNNYAEIILYNKDKEEVGRAIIDLDDINKVKDYKWYMNHKGYIVTKLNNKEIKLHRYIMDCPDGMVVDHINGCKSDNRKTNLRICTQAENNKNISKKKKKNATSQYKGVSLVKKTGRWRAEIKVNNKSTHIGMFDNEYDASVAYDRAAILHYGEYANLNHSVEDYIDYIVDELGLDIDNFIR